MLILKYLIIEFFIGRTGCIKNLFSYIMKKFGNLYNKKIRIRPVYKK